MGAMRRHPADVTADRLGDALDKWPDAFNGGDRDMVSQIIHILTMIAEGGSGWTALPGSSREPVLGRSRREWSRTHPGAAEEWRPR